MLGDQIPVVDLNAVGVDADILVDLASLTIVYDGCLTGSYHIAEPDLGSGGQDAFECTDPRGDTADDHADYCRQRQLYQGECQFSA